MEANEQLTNDWALVALALNAGCEDEAVELGRELLRVHSTEENTSAMRESGLDTPKWNAISERV